MSVPFDHPTEYPFTKTGLDKVDQESNKAIDSGWKSQLRTKDGVDLNY